MERVNPTRRGEAILDQDDRTIQSITQAQGVSTGFDVEAIATAGAASGGASPLGSVRPGTVVSMTGSKSWVDRSFSSDDDSSTESCDSLGARRTFLTFRTTLVDPALESVEAID